MLPAGARDVVGTGWKMELEIPTQGSSDPCTARISHLSSSPSLSCGWQELCGCPARPLPHSRIPRFQLHSRAARLLLAGFSLSSVM